MSGTESKTEECKKEADGAEDPKQSTGSDSLNSVCQLKDEKLDTQAKLTPVANPELLERLKGTQTVVVGSEADTAAGRMKQAVLPAAVERKGPDLQENAKLYELNSSEADNSRQRAAKRSLQIIEGLLPPLSTDISSNEVAALSAEDQKKLRAIFSTATEWDIKELEQLGWSREKMQGDPRLSPSTKEALKILIEFPANKRTDEQSSKIADIALTYSDRELFSEAMAESSRVKRNEYTDQRLAQAFGDKNGKDFRVAKQYVDFGRESPFEHIKANLGFFSDNRDGIKLAISKLSASDLEVLRLGKKLVENDRPIVSDWKKMSGEEQRQYLLGEKIAKGRATGTITPAEEEKAVQFFKNVEAARVYRSLKESALSKSAPTIMPELDAIAQNPNGKLATSLAEMRPPRWGAPAVREVAKVLRDTLIGSENTPPTSEIDLQFYKKNPERLEDINKILDQLRLAPNDAAALKRYFRFLVDGSLSTAEKALYRQPVLESLKNSKTADDMVSIIQNMTDEEIQKYRSDAQFRQDIRKAAQGGALITPEEFDARSSAPKNRIDALTRNMLLAGHATWRLLDKIDQGHRPEPDLVTTLQLAGIRKNSGESKETLKMLQGALTNPQLRERLNSTKPEDQEFIKSFNRASDQAVGSYAHKSIIEPLIKTGVTPLEVLVASGSYLFSVDPSAFESIASAPPTLREKLTTDKALAAKTFAPLGEELSRLAVQVAAEGKFTNADRVWLGINNTYGGRDLIMQTLEKLADEKDGVKQFKADFARTRSGTNLDTVLKDKLSPIEYARARFILSADQGEREKYLEALETFHKSIDGWASRWTETYFDSATRSQNISAFNEYSADVIKASKDFQTALADEKIRNQLRKAIENHLTSRVDLGTYAGDAAGVGVPVAAAAFVGYVMGAPVTVPLTVALAAAGVMSRMGIRQGALGEFYDTRTKNLLIDAITSAVLSGTATVGPAQIARLLGIGQKAGAEAALTAHNILKTGEANFLKEGALEVLIADSEKLMEQTILRAGKSVDERIIRSIAEKVVRTEGFAAEAERQAAVAQVQRALKSGFETVYGDPGKLMRYGKAAGLDATGGFFAGTSSKLTEDTLHGNAPDLDTLLAGLQAALMSTALGTTFRGIGQLKASRANARETASQQSGAEVRKISDTKYEYQAKGQTSATEIVRETKAIEVKTRNGETVRRIEFDGAAPTPDKAAQAAQPSRITIKDGSSDIEITPVKGKENVWQVKRDGHVQELEAKVSAAGDGSYTIDYITDSNASWYKKAYADGAPAENLTRRVTYHPDGRVVFEGPTQNKWYPREGSVFSKDERLGEYWQAPDGKKTWITAEDRVLREVFENVWQADDGLFLDGKRVVKLREVSAEPLKEDAIWINEGENKFIGADGKPVPGAEKLVEPHIAANSETGGYYKVHTGEKKFWLFENGKWEKVDYYLASKQKFDNAYTPIKDSPGQFRKTQEMVVRKLQPGEVFEENVSGGRQVYRGDDGDYVVTSEAKPRGIYKAAYDQLGFVDAPGTTETFSLPKTSGPIVFDPETGIGTAPWVNEATKEQGQIIWYKNEGIIRVVGGNQAARTYTFAQAHSSGVRFHFDDGTGVYINKEGLRFTRPPGEKTWIGEDGSKLIEPGEITTITKYDPRLAPRREQANSVAEALGLTNKARFENPGLNTSTLSDGTIVVTEANVKFVKTPDGVYRIDSDGQFTFLDNNNLTWNGSGEPFKIESSGLVPQHVIMHSSESGGRVFSFKRNAHGEFWDYGSEGGKWIDTSGKIWFRKPGEPTGTWTGEDGALYVEGSWQYTKRSKNDPIRALQGGSALSTLGVLAKPAAAAESNPDTTQLGAKELAILLQKEGQALPEHLLRKLMRAAGQEVLHNSVQALKIGGTLMTGEAARQQLLKLLQEQREQEASRLRPEPTLEATEQSSDPAEKKAAAEGPLAKIEGPKNLSVDEVKNLIAARADYPELQGEALTRAQYIQQNLFANISLYHQIDPGKIPGKSAAEYKANYENALANDRLNLLRGLEIEKTLGIFGPSSREAYNQFMRWAQKDAGPALKRQVQEWQANTSADTFRSLIDEASGKKMSPDLYLARILAGDIKEEGLLKADTKSASEADVARFESTFNSLLEMKRLVDLKQLQNKELILRRLIQDAGLSNKLLRKPDESLSDYVARTEQHVQLSLETKNNIDKLFDLWKRSSDPDFQFSLPPNAGIKIVGNPKIYTQEDLRKPEVQKLLRNARLDEIDPGVAADLRFDHPPGSMQRIIDWNTQSKQRTDKLESRLEEIRKDLNKVAMFMDKPIVGMSVKLDTNNKFAGLVPLGTKPEKPGEVISNDAGLLSFDLQHEKIETGPDVGKYRVVQTVQAYTAPPLAYLDTRALGMKPVGESTIVSDKVYSADDLVPVMNGTQVTYVKASRLGEYKLQQQLSYYGHKAMTAAFDLSIAASASATTVGAMGVRAMSAVEVASASQAAAVKTINWTTADSIKQFTAQFTRIAAVSTAPLNSTGGMALTYNDMAVGYYVNEARGIFYLGEMSFGLARGGYAYFKKLEEVRRIGKEAFEAKEAVRLASGQFTSTNEKLHHLMGTQMPELMTVLKPLDKLNKGLQGPLGLSIGAEQYHKFAGHKTDPLPEGAEGAKTRGIDSKVPESYLGKTPDTKVTLRQTLAELLDKVPEKDNKKAYLDKLVSRVDAILANPGDQKAMHELKHDLIANLSFSKEEWKQLEQAHPDYLKGFKLEGKDLAALLDPTSRNQYPLQLSRLAESILEAKDKDIIAVSRIALMEIARQRPEERFSTTLELPARTNVTTSTDESPQHIISEVPARAEKIELSTEQISKELVYSSLEGTYTARGLASAHQLYLSGTINSSQLAAIYQDVLDNPGSSKDEKIRALTGTAGAGLAWLIETMRAPKDRNSALGFNQFRMSQRDFISSIERLAKDDRQSPELRALAAAQLHALSLDVGLDERYGESDTATPKTDAVIEARKERLEKLALENPRVKALIRAQEEFSSVQPGNRVSSPDANAYFDSVKKRLIKELEGSSSTQDNSVKSLEEQKSRQLAAAHSLLLLNSGKNKDNETDRLAYKTIVRSYSLNSASLRAEVMRIMTPERLNQLEKTDKSSASLLRRQALDSLAIQARSKNQDIAIAAIEDVRRLFKETGILKAATDGTKLEATSTEDDNAQIRSLKERLISFIDKGNKNYVAATPELRIKAIEMLSEDLGAVDAVSKIREHLGAGQSFVINGQTLDFVEQDPKVRLAALNALEKLDNSLVGDRQQDRLKTYLPILLARESNPVVSAAMQLTADRLAIQRPDDIAADYNSDRTIASLMMQSLNDRSSNKRGWTSDQDQIKAWLTTRYGMLTVDGISKSAGDNAKGFIGKWWHNVDAAVERNNIIASIEKDFSLLKVAAGSNEDQANMAKRVLYEIMTGRIQIPGSKVNPIIVNGTYQHKIAQEELNWPVKAAESLATILKEDTSSKDITAMFLLDGMMEARNPQVAQAVLSGLKTLAKDNPAKVQELVSHRLAEFTRLKDVKEGLAGSFVSDMLDFTYGLNPNNQDLISSLPWLRDYSPYPEVKAKAAELMVRNSDPIAQDLKRPADKTLSLAQRETQITESLNKGIADEIAYALRNLEGQDLENSPVLISSLKKGLEHPDPRIKILSARLIFNAGNTIDPKLLVDKSTTENGLLSLKRNAVKELGSLALTPPADSIGQAQLDKDIANRRRAVELLESLKGNITGTEDLRVELSPGIYLSIPRKDGLGPLVEYTQEKEKLIASGYVNTNGEIIKLRLENGLPIASINGVEYEYFNNPSSKGWMNRIKQTVPVGERAREIELKLQPLLKEHELSKL